MSLPPRLLRLMAGLGLAALAALSIACSDEAGDSSAGEGNPHAAVSEIAEAMTAAFPDQALVEDHAGFALGDLQGEGDRVLVAGTAAGLPPFVEVAGTLRGILEDAGWVEDPQHLADGPTSTVSVYTRDGLMAVVAAGASPADPGACPAEQPISACFEGLDPSEIDIHGSVTVVQEDE